MLGGLAFDATKDPIKFWPHGLERAALSPCFVIWCVENGYQEMVPRISAQTIKDKSKANGLAKGLICIQALWFCAQFVTRLSQRLPISLLELNTFAHALCALLVYGFWWSKPFDIEEPTPIFTHGSEKLRSLCAKASFHSHLDLYFMAANNSRFFVQRKHSKPCTVWTRIGWAIERFGYFVNCSINYNYIWEKCNVKDKNRGRLQHPWYPAVYWKDSKIFQSPRRRLGSGIRFTTLPREPDNHPAKPNRFEGIDASLEPYTFIPRTPPAILLRPGDDVPGTSFRLHSIHYCEMDQRTLARLQWALKYSVDSHQPLSAASSLSNLTGANLLSVAAPNYRLLNATPSMVELWSNTVNTTGESGQATDIESQSANSFDAPQAFSLVISSTLYGGLHALAIKIPLHSDIESLLWKLSSLSVISAGFLLVAGALFARLPGVSLLIYYFLKVGARANKLDFWPSSAKDAIPVLARYLLMMIYVPLVLGPPIFYLACRIYLIVEVFLNVPYMDPRVYQTPNWTQYWLHIV